MQRMLYIAGASIVISGMACAKQVADPEYQYRELWSEVAPPMAQRRKVGKWHIPVISELHHAILKHKASKEDNIKERYIQNVFSANGLQGINLARSRVTCRRKLCEYILMYRPNISREQEDKYLRGLGNVTGILCIPLRCQASTFLGGNKITSGLSVLGYFIPTDAGFM